MSRFDYLMDNIDKADFRDDPFRHLYIENFFSEADFSDIISSREVNISAVENDEQLVTALQERHFAYSAEDDRLFRRNVTGDSAASTLVMFSTRIGHVQSRF